MPARVCGCCLYLGASESLFSNIYAPPALESLPSLYLSLCASACVPWPIFVDGLSAYPANWPGPKERVSCHHRLPLLCSQSLTSFVCLQPRHYFMLAHSKSCTSNPHTCLPLTHTHTHAHAKRSSSRNPCMPPPHACNRWPTSCCGMWLIWKPQLTTRWRSTM